MTTIDFAQSLRPLWHLPAHTAREIEDAPMFYRATRDYILDTAEPGSYPWAFASHLDRTGDWIIDSRHHLLMPGWYPAIPGWHHDDVPRTGPGGEPDYSGSRAYYATHVAAVHEASDAPTGSLTQFLAHGTEQTVSYPDDLTGEHLYRRWNREIDAAITARAHVAPDVAYTFTASSFHRVMPALTYGWRAFIRATTDTHIAAENKIRTQTQVYLPDLTGGW